MSAPELSRIIKVRPLPADPVMVEANTVECAALASRFGLTAIEALRAELALEGDGDAVLATGHLCATVIQPCSITGEEFRIVLEEPVSLRFVRESTLRETANEDGEIEVDLSGDDGDEIEYSGDTFDLGEAIAQTLGLAIDPYAEGPGADEARKSARLTGDDAPSGPLAAALSALRKE